MDRFRWTWSRSSRGHGEKVGKDGTWEQFNEAIGRVVSTDTTRNSGQRRRDAMTNPKQLRDTIITLRTTRVIKAILVSLARHDRRSLTSEIEQLLLDEQARRRNRK